MVNEGNVPPDFNAPTGRFRLIAQDTVATDLTVPVAGRGQYALFSDDEISGYMAIYPDNIFRAVGTAYLALAGRASLQAKLVKDFDLQVDLTKRSAALNAAAEAFFERADADDLLSGAHSTFGLTPMNTDPTLAEVTGLPIETWAWKEGIDIPAQINGLPPYLWEW